MIEKENIFVQFLKWIGLIKKTPVDKNEMCQSAQSVCNRKCDECIWNMYDCAERKEEIRPYDPIWDMYLDEFEDDEDIDLECNGCADGCPVYYEMLNEIQHLKDKCRNYEQTIHKLSVALVEQVERKEE